MTKWILLGFLLASTIVKAEPLYFPKLLQNATGTSLGGGKYALDVSLPPGAVSIAGSTLAGSIFGAADPGLLTLSVRHDASGALTGIADGDVTPLQVNNLGELKVSTTISGVATEATLSAINGKIPAQGQAAMAASAPVVISSDQSAVPVSGTFFQATQPVSAAALPLPSGASTAAKQPALGTAGTASSDVISVQGVAGMTALKVDGSAVTQPVSGTFWQATQPVSAASLPLPSGAATEATLSTLEGKIPASLTVTSTRLLVDPSGVTSPVSAASLPLPSGAATAAKQPALGTAGSASADVITVQGVASMTALKVDGSAVTQPTSDVPGANGSGSAAAATVSTVTTLTAPANAKGFVLMNLDTSTANIRWAIGRTATTTLGQQLQSGRDSGFIPCSHDVSVVAESGTQNIDIQWISQ